MSDVDFDRLRDLLLADERVKQDALRADMRALDLRVLELPSLPGALEKPDNVPRLSKALAPPVSEALRQIAHQNPGFFVSILFPIIGPIIRRAIADSIGALLKNLNRTLEHSFSWQGLKWRIEAARTGVSFGRIVLKHSLAYRIEHLFWIESGSGLLLAHAANAGALQADKDAVAGMLTAIADFARDAVLTQASESLDRVELGELSVRLLRAPEAYLAVVIRGEPNAEVFAGLAELVEALHQELPATRRDYLVPAEARLNAWLEQSGRAEALRQDDRPPWKALVVIAVLALMLGSWLAWDLWRRTEKDAELVRVRAVVESASGISVSSLLLEGNVLRVSGRRDPLSPSDRELAALPALKGYAVTGDWRTLISWEPDIVQARVRRNLSLPPEVLTEFDGQTLRLRGVWRAPPAALDAQLLALSSWLQLDTTQLTLDRDAEARAQLRELSTRLMRYALHFSVDDQPRAEDLAQLDPLARDLKRLQELVRALGTPVKLTLVAHADYTGTRAINRRVTTARADWLRAELRQRGLDLAQAASEFRIDPPDVARERARRVRIVVAFPP